MNDDYRHCCCDLNDLCRKYGDEAVERAAEKKFIKKGKLTFLQAAALNASVSAGLVVLAMIVLLNWF